MISIRTAAEERKAQAQRQSELIEARRAAVDETNEKVARLRAMRLAREQAEAEKAEAEAKTKAAAKPAARRARTRR